jgi:hypothetical protein
MPKFLNNAFLVTQSAPSPPSSGGSLYANGSSIYFKNSAGVEYNLTGSKGYISVTEYTTNDTWTTPTDAKYIKIVAVAGGGSGGGGGRNSINSAIAGGGGGQGGDISTVFYPINSIPPGTYTVTVSSITPGGAGRTGTNGSGNNGAIGGTTSLVSASVTLITAVGGTGGTGGSTAASIAGGNRGATSGLLNFGPFRMVGMGGGRCASYQGFVASFSSTANVLSGDYHARNGIRGTGGGGGGSGLTTTTALNGASGSGVWSLISGSLIISGFPGIAGSSPANSGSNGASNVVTAASLFSFSGSAVVTSSYGFGGGGHGAGAGNTGGTVAGGKGGNGGYFGAGGGGGGGAWAQNGGNGGDGAGGYLAILEYY